MLAFAPELADVPEAVIAAIIIMSLIGSAHFILYSVIDIEMEIFIIKPTSE